MFGFVCLSSTLGLLAPWIGPPLAPARRIVARPQNHSNLFEMTSLADPHYLTPMKSHRYQKTPRGHPSHQHPYAPPTILRIFFQVPYALNPLLTHSYENCRGGGLFFPFWNSSFVSGYSTTRLRRASSARGRSTLATPLSMLKLKK